MGTTTEPVGAAGLDLPPLQRGLPTERTSLIGRRRELRELGGSLLASRLVTVIGAAGSGKSRLAQRAAGAASSRHPDGVWYVGLGTVRDPDRLPAVVADAAGLPRTGTADLETLVGRLRTRDGLLLLDDCEHLTDACARLADRIVSHAPRVRMLVTSREPLGVPGEALWALTPLQFPRGSLQPTVDEALRWDAVQLLVERATAVRHDFVMDRDNVEAIVAICRRLDGLPLALELAAARLSHLTAQEVAARLDRRFTLLTSNLRAGGGRHRTLEQAIGWSHDLLGSDEQAVLRRASVFVDACTVAGAEAVCAGDGVDRSGVLEALAGLTAKSFLVAEARDATTHYRFLETVRLYARERLEEHGEVGTACERHARWHLARMVAAARDPGVARPVMTADHEDVAAAIRWAAGHGEADLALGLASGLWRACEVTGLLAEGRSLLRLALGCDGWTDASLRAQTLDGAASLALLQGDLAAAGRLHEAARVICRASEDHHGEAAATRSLGMVALLSGDVATAQARSNEALSAYRRLGDERGIAFSLSSTGLAHRASGDDEAAREAFRESLERFGRLGLHRQAADVLSNLADLAFDTGDLVEARACYQEAGERSTRSGDDRAAALALNNLALVLREQGDLSLAVDICTRSVERLRSVGDRQASAATLNNLANLSVELGAHDLARQHYEASIALYTELGDTTGRNLVLQHLAELEHDAGAEQPTDVLTPREHEVVCLVADGLGNRAIAERLYISERTVESHIAHVRRKLAVTSRTQLVRWVLDHRSPEATPTA